jgi:anhydro-N-acetylmuramic acid kinase
MSKQSRYRVIGLMSGTSLDGLDIAYCLFTCKAGGWSFKIGCAETIPYTTGWHKKLASAQLLGSAELLQLHAEYGTYLGQACRKFIARHVISDVDFIASHGHTIFHQPAKGFTFQLGDGNAIHATSGYPVVNDFRSLDVMLGGEGAPLVPIGDHELFADYDVCLNLGGIANLSTIAKHKRIAYDICFVNMGLNYLANKVGKVYDKNGTLASDGKLNTQLFRQLVSVYKPMEQKRPSMGRELFEKKFKPLLDRETISVEDRLHTFTEVIASKIAEAVRPDRKNISVLCTGGGAFNAYLLYRLMEHSGDRVELIVPEADIVNFKEALIFAFLGVKRVRQETNCLASVTGASRDCSSGMLIGF